MDTMHYYQNAYFDFGTVQENDKIAVDNSYYGNFGPIHYSVYFGTVTRVTKNKIAVSVTTSGNEQRKYEFSRLTGKPLGADKPDGGMRFRAPSMMDAVRARQMLDSAKIKHQLRMEQRSIQDELKRITDSAWNASTLEDLMKVHARIAEWIKD